MKYKVGQGILGEIQFVDGKMPDKKRTYLVVKVDNLDIGVLNVSTVKGKEHKLLYRSNYELKNHNPPFLHPSFVKLDSYTEVTEAFVNKECVLLNKGKTLNQNDLKTILHNFKQYKPT